MFKRRKKDALPDIISIWNKNNAFPDINSKWNTNDAFPDIMTQLLQTPAPAQPRPPVKTKSISSQICLYFFISGCSQINAREVVEGRSRRRYLFFMDWFLFSTWWHWLWNEYNLFQWRIVCLVNRPEILKKKNPNTTEFSELIPKFTITGSANICQQRWEAASKWRQIMSSINRLIEQNRQ